MMDKDISEFRREIDTIDDKIIALLNERSQIVRKVGEKKKHSQQDGVCYIRSGREADLVRKVYARFSDGVFPSRAAVHIWRLIICASLSLESRLEVRVCAAPGSEIYWLSREYFGNFTPISAEDDVVGILNALVQGKTQVGVFPAHGDWWGQLPEGIRIFACIPFLLPREEKAVKAFAVARLTPEPTDNDFSLFKLHADDNTVEGICRKLGMQCKVLDSFQASHLVAFVGTVGQDDEKIAAIRQRTGYELTYLGAYAAPLEI